MDEQILIPVVFYEPCSMIPSIAESIKPCKIAGLVLLDNYVNAQRKSGQKAS